MSSDRSACNDRCYGEPCIHTVTPAPGGPLETRLLEDIAAAEDANMHSRPCQVCTALESMSDEARASVGRALAGTIGEQTLADILTRNGYPTGRRAIRAHRREDHTP